MEPHHIAELLERVTTGDPWHGSNVEQLLAGVSAADAARHPSREVHSIWELVLHMTGWTREVIQRLAGRPAQDPDAGDWPAVGDVSEPQWARAKADLFAAHRELAAAVRALDPATLDQPVVDYRPLDSARGAVSEAEGRDRAAGTGLSRYLTLHGLVHHTLYHSGQIAVVRKML